MDKKKRFTAGLGFGISMSIVFIIQNLSTRSSHTAKEIIISIIAGILLGALSGFLFGWIIGAFAKVVAKTTAIETSPGETIVYETPANHFKGGLGVGGKLYLTNLRLIFKSHKFNFRNHEFSVILSNIKSTGRYKIRGIVNNGLHLETGSGKHEKFAVEKVEELVRLLNEKKQLV